MLFESVTQRKEPVNAKPTKARNLTNQSLPSVPIASVSYSWAFRSSTELTQLFGQAVGGLDGVVAQRKRQCRLRSGKGNQPVLLSLAFLFWGLCTMKLSLVYYGYIKLLFIEKNSSDAVFKGPV